MNLFAADNARVIDQNRDFADFVLHKLGHSINVISAATVTLVTACLEAKRFNLFHRSFVSSLIYVDADHHSVYIWNSTRYHTSKRSKRVRYHVDEKRNFISTSNHVLFCLLYKHTINVTNEDLFDDFSNISEHFPKISGDFPKLFRRPEERSRTFSNISEDSRTRRVSCLQYWDI